MQNNKYLSQDAKFVYIMIAAALFGIMYFFIIPMQTDQACQFGYNSELERCLYEDEVVHFSDGSFCILPTIQDAKLVNMLIDQRDNTQNPVSKKVFENQIRQIITANCF